MSLNFNDKLMKNKGFADSTNQMKSNIKSFSRTSLSFLVGMLMVQTALAENNTNVDSYSPPVTELETIVVSAKEEKNATEATKDVKTSKDIQKNQIDND